MTSCFPQLLYCFFLLLRTTASICLNNRQLSILLFVLFVTLVGRGWHLTVLSSIFLIINYTQHAFMCFFINYLCFLDEVSVNFLSILDGSIYFLIMNHKNLVYIFDMNHLSDTIYKYFLSVYILSFIFLMMPTKQQRFVIFTCEV